MPAVHWEVVGGGDAGGIVVREGRELQSKALEFRLQTGSVVMQVEAVEERVHYYLVMGAGPPEGWVSTKTKSAVLLKERDITAERWFEAIKEMRSKKKDPAAVTSLARELQGIMNKDQRLKMGMATNGLIELCAGVMKAFPQETELQGEMVALTGDLCIFNEYCSRKAGKAGVVEAALAWFKANASDASCQVRLGSLGCYLDYDYENRQQMAALGMFKHAFDMCKLHSQDPDVCFAALCAASNPIEFYPTCAEAGAAETIATVLQNFLWSEKVMSEAGMVAKGLLRSDHAYECAASFGKAGIAEAFLRGVREHLGSRPMQANGCHCIGFIARVPEYRKSIAAEGGIDVILAVIQENTRCPGFCWGLPGMEDSLWRVLDNCCEALMILQHESLENRTAMIRAGAVDILKAALAHDGPNSYAQNLLDVLEKHCQEDPSARSQPRTSFEGRWIQNKRPHSPGIFSISVSEGGLSVSVDRPEEALWSSISFSVNGDEAVATAPAEVVGFTGRLVEGRIHWQIPEGDRVFYPLRTLD